MQFDRLKEFMDFMARERTPGNSVMVYLHGEPVFRYVSGYSDWENLVPLRGDELFNIYSCSKVTTVTAAMQLVEQGKCSLNDPLYAYFPEFREMMVRQPDGTLRKAERPITLFHLFTMTAGFDYDTQSAAIQKAREKTGGRMDTREVVRCLAQEPLWFEPGEHWRYSLCHDVLAGVVEVVSGMKFRDYVRTAILEPLEMHETCYHHTPETLARTAEQYRFVSEADATADLVDLQSFGGASDGFYKNVGKSNYLVLGPEYDSGGAGIITSVPDYAKLMGALGNYGVSKKGARILKPETIDLMRRNALNPVQMEDLSWKQLLGCGYGLGVRTHMDKALSGVRSNIGEYGWGGAAGATVIIDPEIGLGVFYAQHMLNPREEFYQPKLRDVVYECLDY